MIRIIERTDRAALDGFVSHLRERSVVFDSALLSNVSNIIEDVRRRGDEALVEYAARFDKVVFDISELRVSTETLRQVACGKLLCCQHCERRSKTSDISRTTTRRLAEFDSKSGALLVKGSH